MKVKFHSDNNLHLSKTIEFLIVEIAVRDIFHENNKYCTHVF